MLRQKITVTILGVGQMPLSPTQWPHVSVSVWEMLVSLVYIPQSLYNPARIRHELARLCLKIQFTTHALSTLALLAVAEFILVLVIVFVVFIWMLFYVLHASITQTQTTRWIVTCWWRIDTIITSFSIHFADLGRESRWGVAMTSSRRTIGH